jgi:hypothetical protein
MMAQFFAVFAFGMCGGIAAALVVVAIANRLHAEDDARQEEWETWM